jgi:hypothetical protein
MELFSTLFERRERNPLRKKELEDVSNNKQWVEDEKSKLPRKDASKIRKMEKLGVEPERIQTWKDYKIKERENELKDLYLRDKIEKPIIISNIFGIKVYTDQYATYNFTEGSVNLRSVENTVKKIIRDYKDIIPNRKPKFIITDSGKNPRTKGVNIIGSGDDPAGVYRDRLIYIDQKYSDDYEIYAHEYAHFLEKKVSRQTGKYLQEEYKNMLDGFFRSIKQKKRENLEGAENEKYRKAIAKKLGLPTDYSATNHSEWFAELIAHWKNIPNNKATYRFKQIMKKIINRL